MTTTCLGLSLYRFCQCALYGPATMKPLIKRPLRYSNLVCPRSEALRTTVVFNKSVRAYVASLFLWCCPAAVRRTAIGYTLSAMTTRISKRTIDSVNAVICGWHLAHVGIEVLERFRPSGADCFPASSIGWKVFAFRVVAALLHASPRSVFWCIAHSVFAIAAWLATMALVPSEQGSPDRFFCSASASTQPVGCFRWAVDFCNNRPFPELLSGQVYKVVGATIRICVRHTKSPIQVSWVKVQRELQLLSVPFHFSTLAIRGQI